MGESIFDVSLTVRGGCLKSMFTFECIGGTLTTKGVYWVGSNFFLFRPMNISNRHPDSEQIPKKIMH